jgi:hypothetical protein
MPRLSRWGRRLLSGARAYQSLAHPWANDGQCSWANDGQCSGTQLVAGCCPKSPMAWPARSPSFPRDQRRPRAGSWPRTPRTRARRSHCRRCRGPDTKRHRPTEDGLAVGRSCRLTGVKKSPCMAKPRRLCWRLHVVAPVYSGRTGRTLIADPAAHAPPSYVRRV